MALPQRKSHMGAAARCAERKILHGESLLAQHLNDLRFARGAAKQRDFLRGRMKRLEDGILSLRDRGDFDDMALIAEIIAGSFAERTFPLPNLGQYPAFDHH